MVPIRVILGIYGGIMENKMETTIVYWGYMWVVVKIMIPFWIPIIIRHLIFRVPPQKRYHNFDNHPSRVQGGGCKVVRL